MNIYSIASAIPLMALCGCSAKGVYNSRQSSEHIECRKQPPPADQECLEHTHKPTMHICVSVKKCSKTNDVVATII